MTQRYDYELIQSWFPERSRVLDLGCGDGVLLAGLAATNGASGYGIEIDAANVLASVKNGVNVIQTDIESGLANFEDNAFDFVILSQTLQAMRNAESVLNEMLRVGREGIVTFPNFGYWRHRLDIIRGHMPVSKLGKLTIPSRPTRSISRMTLSASRIACRVCDRITKSNEPSPKDDSPLSMSVWITFTPFFTLASTLASSISIP